jgi:cytidine deaminase
MDQVLLDYFPDLTVLVGTSEAPRAVPIAELLPGAYVWSDQETAGA